MDAATLKELDRWQLPLRCGDVVPDLSVARDGGLLVGGCRRPEAWSIPGPGRSPLHIELPFEGRVVQGPEGNLFVLGSTEIVRLDERTGEQLARAALPEERAKHGVWMDESVIVAVGSQLLSFDARTLEQRQTLELDFAPACVDATESHVVAGGRGRLAVLELDSGQLRFVKVPGKPACELGVDGDLIFVHRGPAARALLVLSVEDGTVLDSEQLGTVGPSFMDVDPEHDVFCLTQVQQGVLECYSYTRK